MIDNLCRCRETPYAYVLKPDTLASTVVRSLVPASVSAPSPDPGLDWGLLAGLSLGLRRHAYGLYLAAPRQTRSDPVGLVGEAAPGPAYPGTGRPHPA